MDFIKIAEFSSPHHYFNDLAIGDFFVGLRLLSIKAFLYHGVILVGLRIVYLQNFIRMLWKHFGFNDTCHTPIFDLRCHWHVSFDSAFVRRLALTGLWFLVKNSADRYFKIPHFGSESGPLLSIFIFFLVLVFPSFILILFKFIFLLIFIFYYFLF